MKRAAEMMRLMETVESQQQASHSFPQALGNLANSARFPHSLSSDDGECMWKRKTLFDSLCRTLTRSEVECPLFGRVGNLTLTTGASRAHGLLFYPTQPTPVWVTSLNELTGGPELACR
jgi:hypothetical protein